MKTQHEHKHCKIQLHEIRSILELAFPVMQDSILHERFATFSALQGDEPEYELMKQNLKFLNRLSFAVLAMNKHKEVYLSFDYFLGLYLDRNFNERKSFCWYELKSVLFFVVCFKDVKNYSEFRRRILKESFHLCLAKYKRNDAVDESRVAKATKYYNAMTQQMSLRFGIEIEL